MHYPSHFAVAALGAIALGSAACVPADDALELGGVRFTFGVSQRTAEGIIADEASGYALHFDRIALSFKTMTIGKLGASDVCSYRGRPVTDVVFDPRIGFAQTFNGIEPTDCPDVGILFGPPSNQTTLGSQVRSTDLIELAAGTPAHAIVEATATHAPRFDGSPSTELRIKLRLDSERTSTRFDGCREARRGVLIVANRRDEVTVRFAAENLFRDTLSATADLDVRPFVQADAEGNNDGVLTIDELDALPLTSLLAASDRYRLSDGTKDGSFGDYVRELFRLAIMFRTEEGICYGKEPGAVDDE